MLASLLLNEPVPGRRYIYEIREDFDAEAYEEIIAEVRPAQARPQVKFRNREYVEKFFTRASPLKRQGDDAALALILALGV